MKQCITVPIQPPNHFFKCGQKIEPNFSDSNNKTPKMFALAGSRTRVTSLEGWYDTVTLLMLLIKRHNQVFICNNKSHQRLLAFIEAFRNGRHFLFLKVGG